MIPEGADIRLGGKHRPLCLRVILLNLKNRLVTTAIMRWGLRSRASLHTRSPQRNVLHPRTHRIPPCSTKLHTTRTSTLPNIHSPNPNLNPHAYTSGHWLLNNKQEHSLRYIPFSFPALCHRIHAICPENGPIARCEKLEGGYNRVFVFELQDGRRVIARLPFAAAGRKDVLVGTEVATMAFCMDFLDDACEGDGV